MLGRVLNTPIDQHVFLQKRHTVTYKTYNQQKPAEASQNNSKPV